tara:strand:- start:34895 stop:35752 length:858 start_codon:yes stop_codon:yes gene_type:complete
VKDLLQQADEVPVTLLVALGYVTMAFLTDPISPADQQLHQYGWLLPTLVSDGEPWRLLSSAFLHGGWMHLAFNTYALLSTGPALERTIGSVRMAILYLVAALGGSIAVCVINGPLGPVVGGSGALFGMFGAILAWQMRQANSALGFLNYDGPRRIMWLIAINLAIGMFLPFISNTAHVGGLLTGFGFTFLFLSRSNKTDHWLPAWRIAFAALLATLLMHTLRPTTRWDWLWHQAQASNDMQRRSDLLEAAAMSYGNSNKPTAAAARGLEFSMAKLQRTLAELNKR